MMLKIKILFNMLAYSSCYITNSNLNNNKNSRLNSISRPIIMSIPDYKPSLIINQLAKSSNQLDTWNINELFNNIKDNHITSITLLKQNNQINGIVAIDDKIVDKLPNLDNLHYTETGITQLSDKVVDLIVNNDVFYDIIKVPDMPINEVSSAIMIVFNIIMIYFIISIISSLFQRFGGGGGNNMMNPMSANRLNNNNIIDSNSITTKFIDVAGCEEAKFELQEIVNFLKDPERYYLAGAKVPKGVLLEGPPGTGKTLLARAVAGEAGVSFITISASEFIQMFVGVGAARVRELFDNARKNTPCVIFIDEIDAIGRKRGEQVNGGGNEEREQTLNQILTNMDGFTKSDSIVVMAATNRADILDTALTRSGRFDRKVRVGLPDFVGRKQILDVHLRNKQVDDDTDFDEIGLLTTGFSGADIENMANEAVILALRDNNTIINTGYLVKAFEKITIGLPITSDKLDIDKDTLVAYHEAGHTITAELFKEFFDVRKVTINRNTNGAGGYTLFTQKEKYTQYPTKKFLLANMIVTMGGRAAEILLYNCLTGKDSNKKYTDDKIFTNIKNLDITSGASQDLKQLDNLARRYIELFGYNSDNFYSDINSSGIIQVPTNPYISLSDKTIEKIDENVVKLNKWAIINALKILKKNKNIMIDLANELITNREVSKLYLDKYNITYY